MKYRILLLLLFCLFMCNCSEEQLFEDLYNASAEETILLNNMTSNKMFLTDSLGVEYIEDLISLIPPDFPIMFIRREDGITGYTSYIRRMDLAFSMAIFVSFLHQRM